MATKKGTDRPWTVKERQEAERLRLLGLEIIEIGRRLGRSRASVQDVLAQLGVRKPSDLLRMRGLLRKGERNVDAARRLGISVGYIGVAKYRLRKLGVDI